MSFSQQQYRAGKRRRFQRGGGLVIPEEAERAPDVGDDGEGDVAEQEKTEPRRVQGEHTGLVQHQTWINTSQTILCVLIFTLFAGNL